MADRRRNGVSAAVSAAHVAKRLAALGCEEAIGDIAAALERRIAAKVFHYDPPEIEILADLGRAGCDEVYRVFQRTPDIRIRVPALYALCRRPYAEAFDPARRLFEGLAAKGKSDPRIRTRDENERSRRYYRYVHDLAEGLICVDKKQAYPILVRACLKMSDPRPRKWLAGWIQKLLRDYPHLKDVPVALKAAR